ncbi:hypothetical protein I317_04545 [Kwoniella heveanensis CBS 569]|uniref:Alkyl hydroperoxide reductase subunit C/ Thiol specific antioxidant domain-containing protein n=1 Tax=Kwoniella heveanensis BCC8398 TaxID=1296120 RepID=A0A1B9GJN5_9TREE|nr:hypothetical protein I316_07151 [Kwoniella heveanensis BCC8398]OCF41635.1 hypothetical protein I317_04545 [Kwoniella heveanensis CBS 569]
MTEYLASYIPAIKSLIPRSSPAVATLPELDSTRPSLPPRAEQAIKGKPALIAFVRHCGCPFAEKEVNLLSEQLNQSEGLQVVIVQHSPEAQTKKWFEEIGGARLFPDSSRYTLLSNPSRELYASWGIGSLGWTGMISPSIMNNLKALKAADGIDLRSTGEGSYRWGNSGGFAVDKEGKVKWRDVAEDSSDICDYAQAAKTVLQDSSAPC